MATTPLSRVRVHLSRGNVASPASRSRPERRWFRRRCGDGPTVVKLGHKFAVRSIREGDADPQYGQVIGFAGKTRRRRQSTPTTRLRQVRTRLSPTQRRRRRRRPRRPSTARSWATPRPEPADHRRYHPNYVAIISTVNCSAIPASTSRAGAGTRMFLIFPNIDGWCRSSTSTAARWPTTGRPPPARPHPRRLRQPTRTWPGTSSRPGCETGRRAISSRARTSA